MSRPFRNAIRSLGQPAFHFAKRWLTPPEPQPIVQPVKIESGPAKDCSIHLPIPSELANKIVAGNYESSCVELLQKVVNSNHTCYDIGGHYGYFSLVLARLAPQGSVQCFEPVPDLASNIERSSALSELSNITVYRTAMAGEVGQMQFRYAHQKSLDDSMGYIAHYGGVNTARSQAQYGQFAESTVATTTLTASGVPDPNFIKLDAEGAEVEILRAGIPLISRCKPRMLIEIHGVDLALGCAQILGSIGYIGIAAATRSLMMPVLWIHQKDKPALDQLEEHFHGQTPVLFQCATD